MGLMDSLRRAEQESKALARRGLEKARNGMEEAESTMRRKMRVHPRPPVSIATRPPASEPIPISENNADDPAAGAIVSINGRDVDAEDLDKTAA